MRGDKAAILIKTVLTRTEEGGVFSWTATSSDDRFEASFPNVSMAVVRENGTDEDGDEYNLHYLEVMNQNGVTVEAVRPYDVRQYFSNPWEVLGSLFSLARDQALGVDAAVEELLQSLGGSVPLTRDDKTKAADADELPDEIPF